MNNDAEWQQAPLAQLIDHILAAHHAYLHRELPVISQLLTQHTRKYWMKHPEFLQAHTQFHHGKTALEQHLMQEETAGFPLIQAHEKDASKPLALFVNTMDQHAKAHSDALDALAGVKKTLWNGQLPADIGPEVAITLQQLDALLVDLKQHIHLENDILFPRVKQVA